MMEENRNGEGKAEKKTLQVGQGKENTHRIELLF